MGFALFLVLAWSLAAFVVAMRQREKVQALEKRVAELERERVRS